VRAQAEGIAALVERIGPDKVQLNTATRPPAEDYAQAASPEELEALRPIFGARAEVVADWRGTRAEHELGAKKQDVLEMIRRHPCTVEDIAQGLGMRRDEAAGCVRELSQEGAVSQEPVAGRLYYKASVS
jgi:wyosine [tRNA(Phe)-imidazoG37] synthetase (radical SAM superfamily)